MRGTKGGGLNRGERVRGEKRDKPRAGNTRYMEADRSGSLLNERARHGGCCGERGRRMTNVITASQEREDTCTSSRHDDMQ